ncbi:MAG: hypothetical protein U0176_15050 [Bacteroidia bacterium]
MNPEALIRVGLRQRAIFVPESISANVRPLDGSTAVLVANLAKLGFSVTEDLLHALHSAGEDYQAQVLELLRDVLGVNKNWTPLVKNWLVPTGESLMDHIITYIVNIFGGAGTKLPCGHIIPDGTFPLDRYNGCPFCGTPFVFGEIEKMGQGTKHKLLERWKESDVDAFLKDLLSSKTALDATQRDSLKLLLTERSLPKVTVGMKETLMLLVDMLVELGKDDEASKLFSSPTDILRYLWYKRTGYLQIVEPRTIVKRKSLNSKNLIGWMDASAIAKVEAISDLKLKYGRRDGIRVAKWLNALDEPAEKLAEMMHPKREMWVRFIRALRLVEFAKRPGMERLAALLSMFHSGSYPVWQGRLHHFYLKLDVGETMALLKQRPGLFARSLFASMLWFGPEEPLKAFAEVIDRVPARLVFTLNMYAETYFVPNGSRVVRPLGGVAKSIPNNPLLKNYNHEQLEEMRSGIEDLCLMAMRKRFAKIASESKTMFIDPQLFKMPVSIGDRSEQVQDLPAALMGTRFPVQGDAVRLFMQWGTGLPAMHLDMDLSCHVAYDDRSEVCSYFSLAPVGCKHSGDIRSIPDKVGTAEYIEIDLPTLRKAGARYVTFTSNAYSNGSLSPNMVIGWMDCRKKMHVSEATGVAYDPSTVQHQVRITQSLAKGLIFGLLEMQTSEIIWMEMPFSGQTVMSMDQNAPTTLLRKLNAKLTVGSLLKIKAEAQGIQLVDALPADEEYTPQWAQNAAAVTQLLVD